MFPRGGYQRVVSLAQEQYLGRNLDEVAAIHQHGQHVFADNGRRIFDRGRVVRVAAEGCEERVGAGLLGGRELDLVRC